MAAMEKDGFGREWITDNSVDVCGRYSDGVLTLRGLHYQLVGLGMPNTVQHYKRVVSAMIKARRSGVIAYSQFSDHDRESIGETAAEEVSLSDSIENGKRQVEAWMNHYHRNRWENQPRYVELWIEKTALQGVFQPVSEDHDVALCPCKGYPSLTFLSDAAARFREAEYRDQQPTMIYFGDHDPSGEDIPRSVRDNLASDFAVDVDVQVVALLTSQVEELNLPPAPVKPGDSRSAKFDGIGQVELDAVSPETLQGWANDAITRNFSVASHQELMAAERTEKAEYQRSLREFVENL